MISTAEVQGYLMIHRDGPQAAVEGARAFAQEIVRNKATDTNVAEHANEIKKNGRRATESKDVGKRGLETHKAEHLADGERSDGDDGFTEDEQLFYSEEEDDSEISDSQIV